MALSSHHRLSTQAHRERFIGNGSGLFLRILTRTRNTGVWRAAIRVPARVTAKAVDRNRIRRVLIEHVARYMEKYQQKPIDIIVAVHKAGSEVEMTQELQKHLSSLVLPR